MFIVILLFGVEWLLYVFFLKFSLFDCGFRVLFFLEIEICWLKILFFWIRRRRVFLEIYLFCFKSDKNFFWSGKVGFF